ncbi:terminase TerL endonuclease subunit [Desulfovirgula thermocuniculi]|uniref:terminase TerL endonuclease subunit n=1 Tax=Desulfovirgula thermocuniculi TaxID=348842 RepID=UPI000684718F|nr:terminase TerL endonuclease subunit [Desulfovirgula thermocuniculi]
MADPLRFDPKPLPIDPYVLGVWLGDGRNNRGAIVIEKGDLEIVREIEKRGYAFSPHYSAKQNLVYGTILGIRTVLRQMGLIENKHIPDVYKMASVEQRMDLLRGLMDTDGTVTKSGECRFVSTCKRLARDVYELLLGLGFKAHIRPAPTNGRSDAWIITFKAYHDRPVFCLSRKRERQIRRNGLSTKAQYRWIVAVEEVEPRPARCIAVDSPSHLFLAGDRLIPTHNTKRDQAKIVWDEAANMVKRSPALAKRVKVLSGKANMHITETRSKFEPLGADADTLDGLNVHGAIVDELHAHKTRAVWDVLETATGARRQPLMFAITTAGTDQNSICYELHEYAAGILKGTVQDDTFFAYIATIDEGDDWADPKAWAKANPNLGVSVKLDDLERKCEKAKKLPAAQNTFLRLHLNVWTQQVNRWIDLALWDEQAGIVVEEELRGRICYGGLDLSSVQDITAWVLVFPHEDDPETVDVLCRFWVPEARLHDDHNRYRDQYRAWARQGYLKVIPGNVIDYSFIKAQVLKDAQTFRLVDLNIDRLFQSHQLAVELMEEGLTVVGMGQGFTSMAAPMKEFGRRLLARKIRHGGNPVLRWMADNVAVKQDAAGNLKPDKASSQGKIDGIVALVMALDRAMRHEQPRRSVYEERGILTL